MVSRSPNASPFEGRPAPIAPPRAISESPPPEATEQEINRLTWAVLDGQASIDDRRRLAELVGRQHALRRGVEQK